MKTMTLDEYLAALEAQGVVLEHMALRCPMCATVQSATDLIRAGAGTTFTEVEPYLGFSCVGRWTDAGPPPANKDSGGRGCDWTLGGLFPCHTLEVVTPDSKRHPRFEPVTAAEAQAHRDRLVPTNA